MKVALRLIAFLVWLAGGVAFAAVQFVQLTDPHIFDGGAKRGENEQALQWAIRKINDQVVRGSTFAFVVVTGDLGLEGLIPKDERAKPALPANLAPEAKKLGSLIAESKVPVWLFVPGNNDLVLERPDTIFLYRAFMRELSQAAGPVAVKDLCRRKDLPNSGYHDVQDGQHVCRFIGFDNASFKGNDSATEATANEQSQLAEIAGVAELVAQAGPDAPACIFYHIAEIEDPWWASRPADDEKLREREGTRGELAKAYPLSAWTVTQPVRDAWAGVVNKPNVAGLFTGHFHSPYASVYEGWGWLHDPGKVQASLAKLSIAPPLALKKQEDALVPARGLRTVTIDCASGKVRPQPVEWYRPPPVEKPAAARFGRHALSQLPGLLLFILGCLMLLTSAALGTLTWRIGQLWKVPEGAAGGKWAKRYAAAGTVLSRGAAGALTMASGVFGLLLLWLAVRPAAGSAHGAAFQGSHLLMNFILMPAIVCAVVGTLAWVWRWAAARSGLAASDTPQAVPAVAAGCLGSVVIGFSVLSSLADTQAADAERVLSVGALWALAAMAVGAAIGFLFGSPRSASTATVPAEGGGTVKVTVEQRGKESKTNLEEISDWLSKLIVGGTLFQSHNIIEHLKGAGHYFALTVSEDRTSGLWSGAGSAILIYFGLLGLSGGYFLTRLYLTAALRRADEGERQVVPGQGGLSRSEYDALDDAPLSLGLSRPDYFPLVLEAADKILRHPLETLVNWQDIRLWAKAQLNKENLSPTDLNQAIRGYQRAIEMVPDDAGTRLGYAVALTRWGCSPKLTIGELEHARRSLMSTTNSTVRKNVFKSLTHACLYDSHPESFEKALAYAREYTTPSGALPSGGLWINVACAYGQCASWLEENPPAASIAALGDLNFDLGVEAQPKSTDPKVLRPWLRNQALAALRCAVSRDPKWKMKGRGLLGLKKETQGLKDEDKDLVTFIKDADFIKAVSEPNYGPGTQPVVPDETPAPAPRAPDAPSKSGASPSTASGEPPDGPVS